MYYDPNFRTNGDYRLFITKRLWTLANFSRFVAPGSVLHTVTGAPGNTRMIAFHDDWIEQLYVLPEAQGRGVGSELLDVAKRAYERLQLWTFQRNAQARRFYEARGFKLVEQTDGAGNEEKEPDARYLWARP